MHKEFFKIFASYERAHATYVFKGFDPKGKKIGQGNVIKEQSNPVHWQKHLDGDASLGAFPLLDDHTCMWGAIDIDDMKGLTHKDLIDRIKKFEVPLICFRSASGNAHLYSFFKTPIDATKVREKLISWSSILGFANSELFPKQTYRANKDDCGNWLNLPYFKGNETDRYAFDDEGNKLSCEQFLEFYKTKIITEEVFKPTFAREQGTMFPGGPPCLQHIEQHERGAVEGNRNNFITACVVYLKKSIPDDWKAYPHEFNNTLCDPKLDYQEVENIMKSYAKKDYDYSCKSAPLAQFCNKALCKQQKFGIGKGSTSGLEIDNITKLEGNPIRWIIEVDGVRIEMNTKELMNQSMFREKVSEQINNMVKSVPKKDWEEMIEDAFARLKPSDIISVPEDASDGGQLAILLEDFCMKEATTIDEICQRKTWWDDDGFVYFTSRGLINELEKNKFRYESTSKLYHMLRDLGGNNKVMRVKGKNMRVWFIPHIDKFKHEPKPITTFDEKDNPHKVEKEF